MTATQTHPAAVEAAKAAVDPTHRDENAHMLAGLIHTLGTRLSAVRYETIANGRSDTDRYAVELPVENGVITRFDPADDGECEDDDGRKCRSIRQVRENLEHRIVGLWAAAEQDKNVEGVEEKLREIQKKNLAELEKSPE